MHHIDEWQKNGSIISWLTFNANSTINDFSRQESHGVGTIHYAEHHSPTEDPHGPKCPNAPPKTSIHASHPIFNLVSGILVVPTHSFTDDVPELRPMSYLSIKLAKINFILLVATNRSGRFCQHDE